MTNLIVSFGEGHPSRITSQKKLAWEEYVKILWPNEVPVTDDKASRGWSCPVHFKPAYRDSEHFQKRYALTFDYDHVTPGDLKSIEQSYRHVTYFAYPTWSHTAEKPRYRYVFPLLRGVTYDEFQAVSRKVCAFAGIELAARESHTPAQMMFLPTLKPGQVYPLPMLNEAGTVIDPDEVLATYENWADPRTWPRRLEGDGTHAAGESVDPTTKPGIIGAFCRAYDIPAAIVAFELPYTPGASADRYTYTAGSRPDGAVLYDGGQKLHSHHDTDPARGQTNAFDLVRLHRYGHLDGEEDLAKPVTEHPSFKEMAKEAALLPAVAAQIALEEWEDLGDAPPPTEAPTASKTLARPLKQVWAHPTTPRWLLRDCLEQGVMALIAGPRGSYKSFLALDWAMQIGRTAPVYVVSAEGGDFDRRSAAWAIDRGHGIDRDLYVVERRLNLNGPEGIELIRKDCHQLGIKPVLFVLDTFSKLSAGLDENSNTDVKQFLGWLDVGLKRPEKGFDATVLLVAHTGHSDSSRARGASALEADTDAAYIVSRDDVSGTVRVSRERFKASPELPPLIFKPRIVDLGRCDDDLVPITSLVLDPISDAPAKRSALGPTGKNQRQLLGVVKELAPAGEVLEVRAVLDAVVARLPRDPDVRDTRRQKALSALRSLVQDGFLHMHGENAVSTTSLTVEDDFLDID